MPKNKTTIRVGLVGLGFMGGTHYAAYQRMPGKARLVSLCDVESARLLNLDPKKQCRHVANWRSLLQDPEIDLVDICLPTYLHYEAVREALAAGKHVICEKPLARTACEAQDLVNLAAKSKGRLMVAQVLRFWPEYTVLEDFIKRGTLGVLRSLSLTRLSPKPGWTWKQWILDPKKSGGSLLDLHIHDVDFALHLFGKPQFIQAHGWKGKEGGYDYVNAQFSYDKGLTVHLEGGWGFPASYPFRMAFSAVFSQGSLEFDSARLPQLSAYPAKGPAFFPSVAKRQAAQAQGKGNISDLGGYLIELGYFLDCLLQGKAAAKVTPVSAAQSVETVEWESKVLESGLPIRRMKNPKFPEKK